MIVRLLMLNEPAGIDGSAPVESVMTTSSVMSGTPLRPAQPIQLEPVVHALVVPLVFHEQARNVMSNGSLVAPVRLPLVASRV